MTTKFMVTAAGATFPVHADSEAEVLEGVTKRGLQVESIQEATEGAILRAAAETGVAINSAAAVDVAEPESTEVMLARLQHRFPHLRLYSDEEIAEWEAEQNAEKAAQYLRDAEIPSSYERFTLESYRAVATPSQIRALEQTQTWLDQVDESDATRGVMLWGDPGTGKTFGAVNLLRSWIHTKVRPGLFVVVARRLQALRDSFNPGQVADPAVWNRLLTTPLLVLDDVGAERPTDWVLERLFDVVNERLSKRRPTVYTSNYALDQLETGRLFLGDGMSAKRIVDRIGEHCGLATDHEFVVNVKGVNFRRGRAGGRA